MDMDNQGKKNALIPDYIVEAICTMIQENRHLQDPDEQLAMRIASLCYTSGLTAGLNTALLLCEETNSKIHTSIN